jgi:predicted aspartyl protease
MFRCDFALAAAMLAALTGCTTSVAPDSVEACAYDLAGTLHTTIRGGIPIVDIAVNGKSLHAAFDTGSTATVLFDAAAAALGAPTDWSQMATVTGLNGAAVRHNIAITSFQIGDVPIERKSMAVTQPTPAMDAIADGALGMDILLQFDMDIDLPDQRISLYRWRNCPSGVPNWTSGWRVVPLNADARNTGRALADGSLDGKPVVIMVDSGDATVNVGVQAALRTGLNAATLDADSKVNLNGLGPKSVTGSVHVFKRLELQTYRMTNVRAVVSELAAPGVDVLLGARLLGRRRVWISVASGKMYIADP